MAIDTAVIFGLHHIVHPNDLANMTLRKIDSSPKCVEPGKIDDTVKLGVPKCTMKFGIIKRFWKDRIVIRFDDRMIHAVFLAGIGFPVDNHTSDPVQDTNAFWNCV